VRFKSPFKNLDVFEVAVLVSSSEIGFDNGNTQKVFPFIRLIPVVYILCTRLQFDKYSEIYKWERLCNGHRKSRFSCIRVFI